MPTTPRLAAVRAAGWGWTSGLLVGGGSYLALLAVPAEYTTATSIVAASFLIGLSQNPGSRSMWPLAVPLGLVSSVMVFVLSAGVDRTAPVAWPLRLLAYAAVANAPGYLAAFLGLAVRFAGQRLWRSRGATVL